MTYFCKFYNNEGECMKLECKYYNNQARLANALQYLSDLPSFRFFCINGLVTRSKKEFKVLSDSVTVAVACVLPETGKANMVLVTSDSTLESKNGQVVDTDTLRKDGLYYNLCMLLREKFAASGNRVSIQLTSGEDLLTLKVGEETEGELECLVHKKDGEVAVCGDFAIKSVLDSCDGINSFSYVTNTPEFHREVSVSEGRGEILKEISRYLNRTLVFVSFTSADELLEQYIGQTSALEIITRSNGSKVYKRVLGSKLRDTEPFCVYQSTMRVEDVAREQGRILQNSKRG